MSSHVHQNPKLIGAAVVCQVSINWICYPELRRTFESLPATDSCWHELIGLLKECNSVITEYMREKV
jgi:hypothetical protein